MIPFSGPSLLTPPQEGNTNESRLVPTAQAAPPFHHFIEAGACWHLLYRPLSASPPRRARGAWGTKNCPSVDGRDPRRGVWSGKSRRGRRSNAAGGGDDPQQMRVGAFALPGPPPSSASLPDRTRAAGASTKLRPLPAAALLVGHTQTEAARTDVIKNRQTSAATRGRPDRASIYRLQRPQHHGQCTSSGQSRGSAGRPPLKTREKHRPRGPVRWGDGGGPEGQPWGCPDMAAVYPRD